MTTEQQKDAVLAQGAGYLAQALATMYAGPSAGAMAGQFTQKLAAALLSADDKDYREEILERLRVIEQKLDSILFFLNVQLRDLVKEELKLNDIKNIVAALSGDMVKLKVAVGMFTAAQKRSIRDADQVVLAANEVMASGLKLFERDPGRFVLAVPYVTHAFGCVSLIRALNPDRYDQFIGIWASEFRLRVSPWLMDGRPAGTTFPQELKNARVELATAKALMKDFEAAGKNVMIRYIVGIGESGGRLYPLVAEFRHNEDNTTSSNYIGLSRGGSNVGLFFIGYSTLEEAAAATGAKIHPMITPFRGPSNGISNATEYWRYYSDMFVYRFNRSAQIIHYHPDRIKALEFVVGVLDPFVNGLNTIATLNMGEKAFPVVDEGSGEIQNTQGPSQST